MVLLTEIAQKLENILNGQDSETTAYGYVRDFDYKVAVEGIHIDFIYDKTSKKNFIPVFIGSLGGQFQPIKNLNRADFNIPVTVYFPIRFKDKIFELNDYLVKCFVGTTLNYGTNSGVCLSNISVAQYGEIEKEMLTQFKQWVNSTYTHEINIMDSFMSMTFNLYLSTMNSSLVWGNAYSISLSYTENTTTYTDNDVLFDTTSIRADSEGANEQLLSDTYPKIKGLPVQTAYGMGFTIYVKNTDLYNKIIAKILGGSSQDVQLTLSLIFNSVTYTYNVYLANNSLNITKGEPLTLSLTMAERII